MRASGSSEVGARVIAPGSGTRNADPGVRRHRLVGVADVRELKANHTDAHHAFSSTACGDPGHPMPVAGLVHRVRATLAG